MFATWKISEMRKGYNSSLIIMLSVFSLVGFIRMAEWLSQVLGNQREERGQVIEASHSPSVAQTRNCPTCEVITMEK